jgi:hypothetical protein
MLKRLGYCVGMKTNLIEWMLKVAKEETVTNPQNSSETIIEKTWSGTLRDIVNFEGALNGWNVRVVYNSRIGGQGVHSFHAWRWA